MPNTIQTLIHTLGPIPILIIIGTIATIIYAWYINDILMAEIFFALLAIITFVMVIRRATGYQAPRRTISETRQSKAQAEETRANAALKRSEAKHGSRSTYIYKGEGEAGSERARKSAARTYKK